MSERAPGRRRRGVGRRVRRGRPFRRRRRRRVGVRQLPLVEDARLAQALHVDRTAAAVQLHRPLPEDVLRRLVQLPVEAVERLRYLPSRGPISFGLQPCEPHPALRSARLNTVPEPRSGQARVARPAERQPPVLRLLKLGEDGAHREREALRQPQHCQPLEVGHRRLHELLVRVCVRGERPHLRVVVLEARAAAAAGAPSALRLWRHGRAAQLVELFDVVRALRQVRVRQRVVLEERHRALRRRAHERHRVLCQELERVEAPLVPLVAALAQNLVRMELQIL
mmetsp:Transcript_7657/g.25338  ORF Transcript_7657/g.25338 Transcript_7657/m.25338 type:complete len:282 (+) Transcript_7657:845-1690(+)